MSTHKGSINLIIGCMFSGKTTEIMKIIRRNQSVNKKVMVINYCRDTRYGNDSITSHDLTSINSYMIENLSDIVTSDHYKNVFDESEIICINEGQFFIGLLTFCKLCANNYNKKVYVCGLDGDYKQEKFGELLDLIPCSESVVKLSALCKKCGNEAHFTKRITNSTDQVHIGGADDYIAVCRYHYYND
tara:strand:- start:159 stop:722 length:564 start_codon:yes stop_codon:yes gene_type:complete